MYSTPTDTDHTASLINKHTHTQMSFMTNKRGLHTLLLLFRVTDIVLQFLKSAKNEIGELN